MPANDGRHHRITQRARAGTLSACAAANLYVPLPTQVRQLAHTMLGQVTGPAGTHLLG